MVIKIDLVDVDGKLLSNDNYDAIQVENDFIKIIIKNNDNDFSLRELRWLRTATIDMIYDGGTPETMRGYINLLDKIENIIERKHDK